MTPRSPIGVNGPSGNRSRQRRGPSRRGAYHSKDSGFTLIELLIVTAILPLVIGGLAVGIVSVFRLQSSVSNRLGDTFDSQQISAIFSKDITAAQFVTTDASTLPQCGAGTGTLLLDVDENSNRRNGTLPVISYVLVANAGTSPTTYDFERLYCGGENVTTPSNTQVLAYDVAAGSTLTVNCPDAGGCSPDPSAGWVPSSDVTDISYTVTEQKTSYSYTLAASPVGSINSATQGSPSSVVAGTSCNTASSGSDPLSANLCLVDFSQLATNPALWQAATTPGSCAPMSATVGTADVLYFCLSVSVGAGTNNSTIPYPSTAIPSIPQSSLITPSACVADGFSNSPTADPCFGVTSLPNYSSAFLGLNQYTDVAGEPGLWVNGKGYSSGNKPMAATVTLSSIHLNNAQGQAATGWQLFSADAESTNSNPEYITWTTTGVNSFGQQVTLQPICNQESVDNCSPVSGKPLYYQYWGNACSDYGSSTANFGIVPVPSVNATDPTKDSSEIECLGQMGSSGEPGGTTMTGVGMVEAVTPNNLTVTFGGTNGSLQAVAIGLVLSGLSS